METEELNFLLQSGIVLCKLAAIVVPNTGIETDDLQVILAEKDSHCIYITNTNPNLEWKSHDKEEEHLTLSFCRHQVRSAGQIPLQARGPRSSGPLLQVWHQHHPLILLTHLLSPGSPELCSPWPR